MPENPIHTTQPDGRVADAPGIGATYSAHGDSVTLVMPRDDFDGLLLAIGLAAGASRGQDDMQRFWGFIALANRINRTNPGFRQYEIPAEFARSVTPSSPTARKAATPSKEPLEGFEAPVFPTPAHTFQPVPGNRFCSQCGGGRLHPIHTEYTDAR